MSTSNPRPGPLHAASILSDLGLRVRNSGCCGEDWLPQPGGGELACIAPATEEHVALVVEEIRDDYE
jgi:hypothetical protein